VETAGATEQSSVTSKQDRKSILVLGDSLAAGYGLEPAQAFPALLQEKIDSAGLPFEVINAGVSGDTSAGGLRRLDWLLKRKVDVLILELGGNDGLRGFSPEATRTNLQAIIDRTKAKYPDAQVLITGMQMPTNMGPEYVDKFRQVFPNLAKANQAQLVPLLLEGVAGRADLNQADRIHPTAEGHKLVAENVWKSLKPLLR
jgi:acyl-CoA thioesterase-1